MNCQQGSAGVPLAACLPVPNNPQHALAGKPPVVSQKALLKSPPRAGEIGHPAVPEHSGNYFIGHTSAAPISLRAAQPSHTIYAPNTFYVFLP